MSYEHKTEIGTFVVYNRNEDQIPEVELLGDKWVGTGCWHFGWKDAAQYCYGYRTMEEAEYAMGQYVWALIEDYGWTP